MPQSVGVGEAWPGKHETASWKGVGVGCAGGCRLVYQAQKQACPGASGPPPAEGRLNGKKEGGFKTLPLEELPSIFNGSQN